MSSISLRAVGVALGGNRVVSNVDLEVASGEWVGLVGPNGAGKTTLLGAIAGIVPSEGSIHLDGDDTTSMNARQRARRVAVVPQRPVLPPEMTVIDYVLLGRTPHLGYLAAETADDIEAVYRALGALDLTGLSGRSLGGLSGGELQRVVLARALAQFSPVLLLDEPTAALDVGHQQQVLALIDDLRRECRLTVVSAIHDLTLAAQFCDRLVMMASGRIVADGKAPSVLTESSIHQHYGARVRILDDGDRGIVVIPLRDSPQIGVGGTMSVRDA